MPIYTNDPCDDGLFPVEPSLRSSIGIGPKVTKAIDAATKDWLDEHPEATTTVEDNSLTNAKFMDGSVNSRVIEDESITTDDIADLAVTTPKIANDAVTAIKIANSAADGLRTMNTTQPGVAKVGAGLAINNGALELNGGDIAPAVTAWLNAHPEATTTVQENSITDNLLADTGIKQVLGTMAVRPKLRNGSCRNPGNTDAVCVSKIIPTNGVKAVIVGLDFEEIEGYSYKMSYTEYNIYEDVDPMTPPWTNIVNNRDPYKICESKYEVINLDSRTKAIAIWFFAVSDSDPSTLYPLRIANTGDAFVIYKSPEHIFIEDLKETLSVFMTREAFAYIGFAGKFLFANNDIFDVNGRCAWRLSTNLTIKLPEFVSTVIFDNAAIIESVGNDNITTDGSGTTWIYLQSGRGLVFDRSDNSLKVVVINSNIPLSDSQYPLLLNWSNQVVGGMLYPKFLHDAQEVRINNSINNKLMKEPFAYIGNGGKFIFKDDTIFNDGRCGWRTTDSIIVKLPKSMPQVFSMEQVLNALGDENTVTESGVEWAYITPGKGLVYNSSSNSLVLRVINSTVSLQQDDYPILLVWSLQMVGGMLYPKFLYDAANRLREQDASSGSGQFVSTSLANSRHVPHRANVTVASPLTLLHLSDIHGDSVALDRITEDATRFSSLVDDVICTGDIVANTATEIASWWDESVLTCIGNHDTASYDQSTGYDWTALSMADRDSYYIEPFEENWNIVHTSGTSYYYKDYPESGIRLIVMDCMLYMNATYSTEANAQTAWLTSLLSDAIENSLHVLIAIHAPHGGSEPIACSFSKYGEVTMPTYGDCNTPSVVVNAVASAISNGLTFIGYIVGHTHQDNIWDALNDHTQLMYCVTCAAVSYAPQWQNSDQSRSDTLDAYNLITIDTNNTLVKIVRGGGANIDNRMRQRKAICIDYSNGTVVGEAL